MTRTTTRGIAAVATFLVLAGSGGGRIAAIRAVDLVTGRRVFLSH